MSPKGPFNRTPFTDAEREILQRPGITERQAAKTILRELGIRRGHATCGNERRALRRKEQP